MKTIFLSSIRDLIDDETSWWIQKRKIGGKSWGVYDLNWICGKSRYANLIKQEIDVTIILNHNPVEIQHRQQECRILVQLVAMT